MATGGRGHAVLEDPWRLNEIHTAYVQEGRSILDCTWVVPLSDNVIARVVRVMGWSRPRAGTAPATKVRGARNELPIGGLPIGRGARPVTTRAARSGHRRRGRLF